MVEPSAGLEKTRDVSGREENKDVDGKKKKDEDLLKSLRENVKELPLAGVRAMQTAGQRTVPPKGEVM